MPAAPILLIGDEDLAEEVRRGVEALEAEVVRLPHPTERELMAVFERGGVIAAQRSAVARHTARSDTREPVRRTAAP